MWFEELRDYYPELHTFLTENAVVHYQSGKRIVGDEDDITVLESPSTAPPGLATPKRRTPPSPVAPAAHLSTTQKEKYLSSPAVVQSYDKCIGSLTRRTMTDEYAR